MPRVSVFLSYADSFVGTRLLRQFQQYPSHYDIYGCIVLEESYTSLVPCVSARAQTALPLEGSGPFEAEDSHPTAGVDGTDGSEKPLKSHASCTFFSRLDTLAVRSALLACDWIVLELHQAQTVLEVVQFLQMQPSFERPKRLVLLSSLMTWYATPSLGEGEVAAGDGNDEDDSPAADGEEDVEAPYPPPPPRFLESILAEAQDRSRHAVVDAMRGDESAAKGEDNSGGDGEDEDREDGGDAVASGARAEVLTEDQYNRRVPHLRYLNWRDAERAVAAAHHANGLPLDTFVICGGLTYGGEEDVLEPLFRLAWSAEPEKKENEHAATSATLPIFGSGHQRVPIVHVQDLACFVRKLLRCPADALPFPERRYLFATDGSNQNSWQSIVSAVNRMFGGRCAMHPVAPESYPLYRDVERFTIDLRVEPETMRIIMARTEDAEEGAESSDAVASAQQQLPLPNTWIAEGGIRRHLRAVADEFTAARHVQPHRIAIVGPPLVGKTYLATRVARYYRLPRVSLDSVVLDYTAALKELRSRVESTKAAVREAERERRLGLKRRRLLARQQREWDAQAERLDASLAGAREGVGSPGDNEQDSVEAADLASHGSYRPGSSANRANNYSGPGEAPTGAGADACVATMAVHDDDEAVATELALTQAEEEELDMFVLEWWAEQPQAHAWISKIAEMERVLLLRLHQRPPTPEVNPKKKAATAGGGGANAKKKGNKDAQKTREEEEEQQQLKAALQHAPFQPRALALMLRWRLAQPDCRVQGFVLDGVPTTLELARLVFGDDEDDQLQPPLTEEEALRPRYANEGGAPATAASASDAYLLSRLKAMGAASEEGAVNACGNDDATRNVDVEAFYHALQTYKREYVDMPYSVLSYWECAAATTAPLLSTGSATGEERRAEVHLVAIEGNEPLVPPLPPMSAYAPPQLSSTEKLLEQVILGCPHNFGKSLEEIQREAVRQRCLLAEEEDARAQQIAAQAAAESLECAQESEARSVAEERLLALKQADVAELEARKRPMTNYLQERVLPLLHKGLLEVCATRPADPVDYLAEWLIHHNPHDDIFCDL
ncbi:Dpy-30 motif family protein [Leishmania donovani]|uniref:Dpy-30 motif family protein n=1 Tax=Leishmania donovani TaxID=5661 RepID=A0A504XMH6_LEIDO|nr:Dpy-30 motif family protein [Leishmania donovani]